MNLLAVTGLAISLSDLAVASPLSDAIEADYSYLEKLFQHFHANPELSMQETKTSDRLAKEMSEVGYEVARNSGKTGLVGRLENGNGPTVWIRADMAGALCV